MNVEFFFFWFQGRSMWSVQPRLFGVHPKIGGQKGAFLIGASVMARWV